MMLALPPLTIDSAEWWLPLCDATAMDLCQSLVEDSSAKQVARLASALASDPALAIWARLQAAHSIPEASAATPFDRIPLLAQWLANVYWRSSNWHQPLSAVTLDAEQQSRFASLVAESVGAAREATRGFPSDFAFMQPAYLQQLTAQWQQWLSVANSGEICLEKTTMATAFPPNVPTIQVVWAEATLTADEARQRWLTIIPGVQSLFPQLASRVQQIQQSEASFDIRLQNAKLDAMKEFAYGAGHELNNPLANIASRAQMLLTEERDPERRRRLTAINTQAFRAHEMLADMMLFARPPKPRFEQVDLVQLAEQVLSELADEAAQQETKLARIGESAPCMIVADPTQLRVALRAMGINSLEALGRGGTVTLKISAQKSAITSSESGNSNQAAPPSVPCAPKPSEVQITISDDGPGIPDDIRGKIFDPFFSGREAGRGLGFGLSKCWRIVTLHGGTIEAKSECERGAKFIISLPAIQQAKSL